MASVEQQRARWAATVMFVVVGSFGAAWGTRIPAIKADLNLSPGALALAILGLEGGAVLGLPAGAALAARLGSRASLRLGFAVFAPGLVAVSLAPSLAALAAALAATALGNSVVDVALNSQGIELERRCGRPLLSGLHAGHPVGLVVGGLAGTGVAAAGVSVDAHFAVAAATGLLIAFAASAWLVAESDRGDRPAFARPGRRLVLLGLLAFCAFGLDGAAYNWSAVDMRTEHAAAAGIAAAAFTGFAFTLAVGRVVGDRLVARHGRVRVVQACGAVAALGGAVVVVAPSALLGLAGWALLGLGLAAVAPTLLGAAPRTGDAPPAAAIAAVTTIGYLGSFTGPPLIGGLAQAVGLSAALLTLVAAGLVLAGFARRALAQVAADIPAAAGTSRDSDDGGRPATPFGRSFIKRP